MDKQEVYLKRIEMRDHWLGISDVSLGELECGRIRDLLFENAYAVSMIIFTDAVIVDVALFEGLLESISRMDVYDKVSLHFQRMTFSPDSMRAVMECLQRTRHIKWFEIRDSEYTDKTVEDIFANGLPNTHLSDLEVIRFFPETLALRIQKLLAEHRLDKIRRLMFVDMMTMSQTIEFAKVLVDSQVESLECMYMIESEEEALPGDPPLLDQLFAVLARCENLKELNVEGLHNVSEDDISAMEVLRVERIDFGELDLSLEEVDGIAEMIEGNPNLKEIKMFHAGNFGTFEYQALAQLVGKPKVLELFKDPFRMTPQELRHRLVSGREEAALVMSTARSVPRLAARSNLVVLPEEILRMVFGALPNNRHRGTPREQAIYGFGQEILQKYGMIADGDEEEEDE